MGHRIGKAKIHTPAPQVVARPDLQKSKPKLKSPTKKTTNLSKDSLGTVKAKTNLAPKAAMPMNGAFGQKASHLATPAKKTIATKSSWAGPTFPNGAMGEDAEKSLLKANNGKAVLVPYGDFDPSREPVVIVHGINGTPGDLKDVAEGLTAKGKQVFIVAYSDRGTQTHESGQEVAKALANLRSEYYPKGTSLDIVAHSMGGIVSRAALNSLADPNWTGDSDVGKANPRAGFGDVRLRTMDTPWDGFGHESDTISPVIAPVVRFFMKLFGWLGAFDMRGNSKMFDNLYKPELKGVDIQNSAAVQNGEPDAMRSVPDLSVSERSQIAKYMLGGQMPSEHRTGNMAKSLSQDSRYNKLKTALKKEMQNTRQDKDALAVALSKVYDQVMPRFEGSHGEVMHDNKSRDDDMVDHLINELG